MSYMVHTVERSLSSATAGPADDRCLTNQQSVAVLSVSIETTCPRSVGARMRIIYTAVAKSRMLIVKVGSVGASVGTGNRYVANGLLTSLKSETGHC